MYGEHAVADAGRSVDLSADGSIVAVGAPNTTANNVFFAGKVKVYELQNNSWVQKGGDINGDGSIIKFGQSVSLSDNGNIIAIGQSGDPSNSNPADTGRVKVYQYVGNQWVQLGNTILGTMDRDEFGFSLSLSAAGNVLAIGTYGKSEVKVFELINGVWTQIGNTLFGNSSGDSFGFSVSLSGSGSLLAVGARFINLSNNQPGSAYIFENQGGNWILVNNPIVGVAPADQAGFSVAISQNGKVAVGSIGNDSVASNAGHVRVFENNLLPTSAPDLDINSISFYPNPTNGIVKFTSPERIERVTIYNLLGQEVFSNAIYSMEFTIDLSNLPSGTYVAQLSKDGNSQSVRLIKM